jgi:methionyl aminopeptidase
LHLKQLKLPIVIQLKTPAQIALMARAGTLLASVLQELQAACSPGVPTQELDQLAQDLIRSGGATPGFWGYRGFPRSLCISLNDEVIHGIPGPRRLAKGDLVSLDLGLVLDGWWADAGRTVGVGPLSPAAAHLLAITQSALAAGIAQARSGNSLGDISAAIQSHAETAGFSVVRSYAGHGVGRSLHEEPSVPNFGAPKTGPRLRSGMTLAIEPMLNAGGPEVDLLPDGWTVRTRDHSLSAFFEHTVAITPNGPRILTLPA